LQRLFISVIVIFAVVHAQQLSLPFLAVQLAVRWSFLLSRQRDLFCSASGRKDNDRTWKDSQNNFQAATRRASEGASMEEIKTEKILGADEEKLQL
jgi:hypothetical protein